MKTWLILIFTSLLSIAPAYSDQTAPELDSLFDALQDSTTSASEASMITSQIWRQWISSEDVKAQELMDKGIRSMNRFSLMEAVEVFSELIEMAPNFAEAWNKRATVYYMMGKFDLSTADVEKTLALEPRHFGALSGQGLIYLQNDQKQAAVDWFKRALDMNPFMDNIRMSVQQLEEEIKGKII